MTAREIQRRPGGRSARVRRAVIEATLQVLREGTLEEFSIVRVAEVAGVNPTSIYRRWGTKERLLLDSLISEGESRAVFPDTGTLLGDLAAHVEAVAQYLRSPGGSAFIRVLAHARDAEELAPERKDYLQDRLQHLEVILDRARARGEVQGPIVLRAVLDTLDAPLQVRMITGEPIEDDLPERVARLAVAGLAAGVFAGELV